MRNFFKDNITEIIITASLAALLTAVFVSVGFLLNQINSDKVLFSTYNQFYQPLATRIIIESITQPIVEPEISIIFGGDVMLARQVQVLQERSGSFLTAWENIADVFKQADLAVINLESPFSQILPYPDAGFVFKIKPDNINGLEFAGIDVVNLANNHFGNAGVAGAEFTFTHLTNNNIKYIGAGRNDSEAYDGIIVKKNDIRIGLVGQVYDAGFGVGETNAGVAILDIEKLNNSIKKLKVEADIIIAIFHGGIEYVRYPNKDQIAFAHAAIDAGADVVIEHHPHWIQNIEEYKGKYIFYSLGNLIFDQNWSLRTSEGLVVQVQADKQGINSYKLLPVMIEDNFKPRWVDLQQDEFVSLKEIENDLDKKLD